MMRCFPSLLLIWSCFLSFSGSAQIRMNQVEPYSEVYLREASNDRSLSQRSLKPESEIDRHRLDVDVEAFLQLEEEGDHIAAAVEAGLSFENSGTWEELDNGGRLWRLKVISPGATSLNFEFSEFFIPHGASLTLYNDDKSLVMGPFNSLHNRENEGFATHLLFSESITLEYFEPHWSKGRGKLNISYIGHGILPQDVASGEPGGNRGTWLTIADDLDCTTNANCSEGNGLDDLKRAVCEILYRRRFFFDRCTGTLINNEEENCEPLILTAGHCFDNDPTIDPLSISHRVFRFNYIRTGCPPNGPIDLTKIIDYCGAQFRANWHYGADIGILEMTTHPIYQEYFAGWSNAENWETPTATPYQGRILSHPGGNAMKVYYDDVGITDLSFEYMFDLGQSQQLYGGASGSPMINDNLHIQGVVARRNGSFNCSNPGFTNEEAYGSNLFAAWNFPAHHNSVTLQQILAPNNPNTIVRVDGQERFSAGCAPNLPNCCHLVSSYVEDAVVKINYQTDGTYEECCTNLIMDVQSSYLTFGCTKTARVRITEEGELPMAIQTVTLPFEMEICRDMSIEGPARDAVMYTIEFLDNNDVVVGRCTRTVPFVCEKCECDLGYAVEWIEDPSYDQGANDDCRFNAVLRTNDSECPIPPNLELIVYDQNQSVVPGVINVGDGASSESHTYELRDINTGVIICSGEIPNVTCENCCDFEAIFFGSGPAGSGDNCCRIMDIWQNPECQAANSITVAYSDAPETIVYSGNPVSNFLYCSNILVSSNPLIYRIEVIVKFYDENGELICTKTFSDEDCYPNSGGGGGPSHRVEPGAATAEILAFAMSPNPSDQQTVISYSLSQDAEVTLELLDATGKRVEWLLNETRPANENRFELETSGLASGIYFIRLSTNESSKTLPLSVSR